MTQPAKHLFLLILVILSCSPAFGQRLSGVVIDAQTREVVPETHVINKRTLKGTLTNQNGHFSLSMEWGDTVLFSNIAYQYFYFIYNDSSTALSDVLIELKEQHYMLGETSVFSYKLTTNDDKEIVLKEPRRPRSEQLSDGRIVQANMGNPAEFLYNLFGSKPRQLRLLAQLKAEEAYRDKLEHSNNREIVLELTNLELKELEAFMFYCKFAPVRMRSMNDYEFLISVQHCFRQYVREREMEDFLQQWD